MMHLPTVLLTLFSVTTLLWVSKTVVVVTAVPVKIGDTTYPDQQALINSGKRCGTPEPTPEQVIATNKIVTQWVQANSGSVRTTQDIPTDVKTIDTYFHVITSGTTGKISSSKLRAQYDIFKKEFLKYGFKFVLRNTTYTDNDSWYNSDPMSKKDKEMRKTLKVGGIETLNVYFAFCSGALGYSFFPEWYDTEFDGVFDGACIYSETVPGGSAVPFDEGKTLIHEIGHWLGLYHTFPDFGGTTSKLCNNIGDTIADTPRMAEPTSGCPVGKDTCPNHPGKDPINNYMDYSDDACLTKFTSCQKNRMHAMWEKYRKPK